MNQSVLIFAISILIGLGGFYIGDFLTQSSPSPLSDTAVSPTPSGTYQFSIEPPPSDTLVGIITQMDGTIQWESRVATEPAELTEKVPVAQGEKLITDKDGTISVQFATDTTIALEPESELNIVQTLPASFVFNQLKGTVTYDQDTDTIPVAVRARHLLIRIRSGSIIISFADDDPYITVDGTKGAFEVAYNDRELVSHRLSVEEGDTLIFDDETRTTRVR